MHGLSAALAIKRQRKKRGGRRLSSAPTLAAYLASEQTQKRITANKVCEYNSMLRSEMLQNFWWD